MRNNHLTTVLIFLVISSFNIASAQGQPLKINASFIAFAVPEKDLLPESIAYDSVTGAFFIGSTRKGKILKIDKEGKITDFITQKENDLWMVTGIQADIPKRFLWVCSAGGDNLVHYERRDDFDGRPSGIFKFNLDTGKLIKRYILDKESEIHFFNDMVIAKDGTVYITHMFREYAIYKIGEDDRLEKFVDLSDFPYPNGITISDDNKHLFVAHSGGVARIDLESGEVKNLKVPEEVKIAGKESMDGIYYFKGSLVGVQPDIRTVQRFYLNKEEDAITESAILEVNHPMMDNPTTGEIVAGYFYYIANAQFGSFNDDGSLYDLDQLYEPVILKTQLLNETIY